MREKKTYVIKTESLEILFEKNGESIKIINMIEDISKKAGM